MFQKAQGVKLYEEVVQQILMMISEGTFQKGDMLPSEKELTLLTGVSRVTVREALRVLSEMGVVTTRKGVGTFVQTIPAMDSLKEQFSPSFGHFKIDFENSSQIRLLFEPEIARTAAKIAVPEQVERLKTCLNPQFECQNAPAPALKANDSFHSELVSILDNTALTTFFNSLMSLEEFPVKTCLKAPESMPRYERTIEEQKWNILSAIEKQDGEFAYFYMKEHLRYVIGIYEKYFKLFS